MSKNINDFYFDNFIKCSEFTCKAAEMLGAIIKNFDGGITENQIQDIHHIEHSGDNQRHTVMEAIVKAFITPIDREDIIKLNEMIDSVTDSIEDIIIQMHIACIRKLREECSEYAELIINCCETLKSMLVEFKDFRKSKKLKSIIIDLNQIEEEGDRLYIKSMRNLHASSKDPLEILVWREIYTHFENVFDACEDVAEIVESIAIENT